MLASLPLERCRRVLGGPAHPEAHGDVRGWEFPVSDKSGQSAPLVLVSYLPGEGSLTSDRYRVNRILCDTDLSYSRGLAVHWDHPGALVNVEHDLEWTDDHIAVLLACKYAVCSWATPLHWANTGHVADEYAHKVDGLPVAYGTEWADWSAPGFMKIAPGARTGPMVECHWRRVEDAVNAAVTGPWHLHWPSVNHWHF